VRWREKKPFSALCRSKLVIHARNPRYVIGKLYLSSNSYFQTWVQMARVCDKNEDGSWLSGTATDYAFGFLDEN
jgi:hypothetical protein